MINQDLELEVCREERDHYQDYFEQTKVTLAAVRAELEKSKLDYELLKDDYGQLMMDLERARTRLKEKHEN